MSRHLARRDDATDPGVRSDGHRAPVDSGGAAPPVAVTAVGVGHDVPGRLHVLDDVSVTVGRGELIVVSGRSGSGKSTLCHLVAGVGRPTRGSITVLDRPAHDWADWTRVTLLPQRLALIPELTVVENVTWPHLLEGHRHDPTPLLDSLGLAHIADQPALGTSLGEQQRTALARALASRPDLAVLDEPTGHQDDANVERVLAALAARDPATAVLIATHDERVLAVADRVVALEAGRLVTRRDRP